ncbi:expansin EXLX1 family cellulose-binding protein [Kitasatospora sp. McL0602]|uniref:expansin EXLX1 family cellulose-binding protein n=1 Tax=Kitasatospora sp. McL0602 TaxID=3439530 RepID=UPI003F8C7834
MKATKHAAPRRWHGRGPVRGVALATLAAGVLTCLALTSGTGGGAGAGRPVAGSAAPAVPAVSPAVGTPASGGGASVSAAPSSTSPAPPPPSPPPSPSPSAAPTVTASGSAGAAAGTATLAGRIKPGVARQGVATAYAAADGNGSCLYGPTDDMMVAAMNHADYESAKACGAYVSLRTASGATLTVRIVNECPPPCAPGQLDLSQQAFAKLADLSVGRLAITWTLLSPENAGTISIRYKTGSTKWWCGIQVLGHRNPVAELEVRGAGGWRQLPRTDYNYFVSADGTGCGGEIRITDVYGQQLTVDGMTVRPDVVQPAGVQFARH